MEKKTASAIMLTLLLTSMLTLAFNIQLVNADLSGLPVVEWSHTYGGSNWEYGTSLVQTSDGGYALLGDTSSFGAGMDDLWLVKTDPYGNQMWTQTYGGVSDEGACNKNCLIQTSDGGFVFAGRTESFGAGSSDIWLVKTDSAGVMEWNKTFGTVKLEVAYSVIQTSDGGCMVVGYTGDPAEMDTDVYIVKTNAFGNKLWNKTYDVLDLDFAVDIVEITDGYVVVGCTSMYGYGGTWLAKLDVSGNVEWDRMYENCSARALSKTADGGYAITGDCPYPMDFCLIKTDSAGNIQWNKTFGGPEIDCAISEVTTADGGFVVVGYTSSFGAGMSDVWLVKTDAFGNMKWNLTYGGPGSEWGCSIVKVGDGEYAVAGYTCFDLLLIKVRETLPPPIYSLTITAAVGGTTSPAPGTYQFERGKVATVRAWQHSGYQFDHWELDTVNVGSTNPYSLTMNAAHTLRAVFKTSQRPIASFVYSPSPLNPVIGEEIVFDASQSMGATLYTWDFNDGHVTSTSNPKTTHSYSTTGTYKVNLTAINSNGKSDITGKTVTVKKPPVVLVHGFQSNDNYNEEEIWRVMKDSLTSSGFTVYISHYAWGAVTSEPIRRYAESLKWDIDHIRLSENVDKVDIVAHSMGGLVARWYIEFGEGDKSVRKLIMLETPNRGCLLPGFSGLLKTAVATCIIAGVDPQVKTWADRISSMVDKIPSWILSDEQKAEKKLLYYSIYVCSNLARAIEIINNWPSYVDILAGLPYVNPRIIQNVHYVNIIGYLGIIPEAYDAFTLDGVESKQFSGWANWHSRLPESEEVIQYVRFILGDDPGSYYYGTQEARNPEIQSAPSISARIFQSEEKWHAIAISNTSTANFVLVWSAGLLNLTLASPNGTLIDPSYANPNVTYYDDSQLTIKGYAIKNPDAGIWNVSVLGANVSVQGEDYALLTYLDTDTTLSVELPKNLYEPNEALSIRANLTSCDQPTTGASINAVIQKPDGLTENAILYDDGLHGDNQANDGLYANTFTNTSLWGKYSITVVANGSVNNEQFAREAFATAWVEQYPDLSLSESDIYFSKETATEGEIITINATVHNIGEADANNASILFYDGNPANGTLIGECVVNVIAGEAENASIQWNATRGTHQINALISPYNEFLELNYTNNIASRAIRASGHDITLLTITISKTVVGQTYEMPIDVIVENQGDFQENFNVTLLANTTIIGKQTADNFPNGTWTILVFTWNTSGFAKGNYTISAYAQPVSGETDTPDNNCTDGWVKVTMPGDVTGEGTCNMLDIQIMINKFMASPPDPRYDPNVDVNNDGSINMVEIQIAINNFLKPDP
jgi:PKD repeat protein